MLTTNLKFASINLFLASRSPASIRLARSTSSAAVKSETFPISRRYILTGSVNGMSSSFPISLSTVGIYSSRESEVDGIFPILALSTTSIPIS